MINLFLILRKNVFSEKTTKEKLLKIKILKNFIKSVENCKEILRIEDICINSNDCMQKNILYIGEKQFHSNEKIKCECPIEKSHLCKNKYCTSNKLLCERFHNLDSTTGIKPCNNSIIIEKINPKISFKYRF
jgi:hypothetical protein